jgi:mono/diheme cytochrome c family protein
MRRLIALSFSLLAGCAQAPLAPTTRPPMSVAEERGQALVQHDCAACHAIEDGLGSPNPSAPAFATIRLRYNSLSLERLLTTISHDGHWEMPRRPLSTTDVQDLVAFIESPDP